jgi:hypothetical protein
VGEGTCAEKAVRSREPSLPAEYIPELEAACDRAGLKWTDFQMTDNTCKPHPPAKSILEKVRCLAALHLAGMACNSDLAEIMGW